MHVENPITTVETSRKLLLLTNKIKIVQYGFPKKGAQEKAQKSSAEKSARVLHFVVLSAKEAKHMKKPASEHVE